MKVHFSDENEVREYFLEDDVTFDRMPTSIKKTENQGLVIGEFIICVVFDRCDRLYRRVNTERE